MFTTRIRRPLAVVWWCALLLICTSSGVNAHLPLSLNDNERPTLSPLLEEVMPAVVSIAVTGSDQRPTGGGSKTRIFDATFNFPTQVRQCHGEVPVRV